MSKLRLLTHGGSGSPSSFCDGAEKAARAGLAAGARGAALTDSVLAAMDVLEDDPRFNAGTGSSLRADGKTIQMDASFMVSAGAEDLAPSFGAITCVEGIRYPARAAFALSKRGGAVLSGSGATRFARGLGHAVHDPMTDGALRKFKNLSPSCDTVGCVAGDGRGFAASLSSGGLTGCALGRVGDVPLPGCGLYAGSEGAVAFTGIGEEILRRVAAFRAYERLASGVAAPEVLEEVRGWFKDIEFGCLLLGRDSHAAGSSEDMAWAFAQSGPA